MTRAEAGASAEMFSTSVESLGRIFSGASATALSEVTFSATSDVATSLGLDFAGWHEWAFSEGSISLLDLTTGLEVWAYGWVFPRRGNVPWIEDPFETDLTLPRATASINAFTELLSSHTYRLTMKSMVGADSDSQRITMRVSGLAPVRVSEPATLLLLAVGAMMMLRRKREE